MDLNDDGHVDILSGSYSRKSSDMAGLFQVLWGLEGGGFAAAEPLLGSDGEPLVLSGGRTDKICTRPTAADLDGDGDLDLVVGNFPGGFQTFEGLGEGRFAPQARELRWYRPVAGAADAALGRDGDSGASAGPELEDAGPLRVRGHSDPVLADWDGDGDLDLISGGADGVTLLPNLGSASEPRFGEGVLLYDARPNQSWGAPEEYGHGHLAGPAKSLRVAVAELNGDGKLDLLVGDARVLHYLAEGATPAEARAALRLHQEEFNAAYEASNDANGIAGAREILQESLAEIDARRNETVREERTGTVWALHRL